ncbi:DUF695 domain-containing protein [Pedobacter helvus]|uniref:DUF695 domain-containing protein n=1 Tax=Pedobacter helvus TaxID=2563444 RepID=A0ABW9JHH1_9SPHI|nr:DUF695 domain-containing protein [Pedobacter ureilyticus]
MQKIFRREKSTIDWEQIKNSDLAYPKHSFSILKLTMPSGQIGTGWVDKGYKKYDYKEFCPYNIEIEIDLTDPIAESNADLDMATVEDFFSENLKKNCIFHLVSRVATEKGMSIIAYTEYEEQINILLRNIIADKKRLVTFEFKMTYDPKWKKTRTIL